MLFILPAMHAHGWYREGDPLSLKYLDIYGRLEDIQLQNTECRKNRPVPWSQPLTLIQGRLHPMEGQNYFFRSLPIV